MILANSTTAWADALVPDAITYYPFYYTPRPSLLSFMNDRDISLAAPIIAYWALCLVFHALDVSEWRWLDPYRIHDSEEVRSRNLVSKTEVVKAVLVQQAIQTLLGWLWMDSEEEVVKTGFALVRDMRRVVPWLVQSVYVLLGQRTGNAVLEQYGQELVSFVYWWAIPAAQLIFAFFLIDTWQYFLHRAFHTNKFLYRHVHSIHHRLYAPWAGAALYNHPLEGLLLDTLGAAIAHSLSLMTIRQAIFLFTFSTLKTVDDHCGFALPWDPLQFLFGNNADYHDIHHQTLGIKKNFSQPFFIHWDVVLGTRMTREDIEKLKIGTKEKVKEKEL